MSKQATFKTLEELKPSLVELGVIKDIWTKKSTDGSEYILWINLDDAFNTSLKITSTTGLFVDLLYDKTVTKTERASVFDEK